MSQPAKWLLAHSIEPIFTKIFWIAQNAFCSYIQTVSQPAKWLLDHKSSCIRKSASACSGISAPPSARWSTAMWVLLTSWSVRPTLPDRSVNKAWRGQASLLVPPRLLLSKIVAMWRKNSIFALDKCLTKWQTIARTTRLTGIWLSRTPKVPLLAIGGFDRIIDRMYT